MNHPTLRAMMADPAIFRQNVLVDTDKGSRPLDAILDPWQREDFEALDPAWRRVIGQPVEGGCQRAYLERGRGHSKTSDLAVMASWALFAAPKPIVGIAASGDVDQASLLRAAMSRLVGHNPWLGEFLDISRFKISNPHTGSELQVVTSDAATSYGWLADFIIVDEISNWPGQSGEDFWTAIFSTAAKRENCLLVCISNAGLGRGKCWQWNVREHARTSTSWHFHRLDGPIASWISPENLVEQEAMLPSKAYRRLWLNEWCDDSGDALDSASIQAAITLDGPMPCAEHGYLFGGAIDIGIRHDHSSLVVLAVKPGSNRIRLVWCESWAPGPEGQVDLQQVENAALEAAKRYNLSYLWYDPHQCELMAQRLTEAGIHCVPRFFVGQHLDEMARTLLQVFRSRMIDLYPDKALIDDLHALSIVEKSWGFKLEAPRGPSGHCDRAIALAICLPPALTTAREPMQPAGELFFEQLPF